MKAIVQTAYGAPDEVLTYRDIATPVAGIGEVLVRVRAASLHPDVWHTVRGRPFVLRIMGAGLRAPNHPVLGTDVAGIVEATGSDVTRFRPGDEVYGEIVRSNQWRNGGAFAAFAAVPDDLLTSKPANLSFEEAAAVPTSALIALRGMRTEGRVRAGQRVLINGAGGGVGTFALQIAKAYGADVTAVDDTAKLDMLRSIGADRVIDYTREDFTRSDSPYDLILDIAGNRSWSEIKRAIASDGTYVLIGHDHFGASGGRWLGSLGKFFGLLVRSPFERRIPGIRSFKGPDDDPMAVVTAFIENGRVRPVVGHTFPLREVPEAIRFMETGHARGKIVITV